MERSGSAGLLSVGVGQLNMTVQAALLAFTDVSSAMSATERTALMPEPEPT